MKQIGMENSAPSATSHRYLIHWGACFTANGMKQGSKRPSGKHSPGLCQSLNARKPWKKAFASAKKYVSRNVNLCG